jgi:hypothetical protein
MNAAAPVSVVRSILWPAVVTLAVTLLRLTGELQGWSPTFFSRQAGGAGAVVGITWLVPVFGAYFALRLLRLGHAPVGPGRALGHAGVALAIPIVLGVVAGRLLALAQNVTLVLVFLGAVAAVPIAVRGWPALGRTLLAYALAARIPVVIVMLIAILNDWGTHYDVAPPDFPPMGPVPKWFWIGVVPQLTLWIGFTVIVGSLCGGLAAAALRRKQAPTTEQEGT